VLYGSNLGTAEEVARRVAESGEAGGFAVTVAPLDDYAGRLPGEGAVVITSASYNGTPPDNAVRFCEWLRAAEPDHVSLAGVRYTVWGCGNRDWASTFQAVPRLIDERLAALGAERLYPRGEGDAREDFDGQFQAWQDPLLGTLAKALGVELAPAETAEAAHLTVEDVEGGEASPFVDSLGARAMRVAVNRELHTRTGADPSPR
jgi:cytochrome P450/NADPH-cytochrome P450 reductase